MTNQPVLADALLVKLTISLWGAASTDKAVSADVAERYAASSDAGRYTKNLIHPDALKGVRAAATALRDYHKQVTRPYEDGGRRLLPGVLTSEYQSRMLELTSDFHDQVGLFLLIYPEYVEKARDGMLGAMFDENQYPHVNDLGESFRVVTGFEPLPSGAALPMTLRDREALAAGIEKQSREALAESAQALFYRVKNTIAGLGQRLKHYSDKEAAGERTRFMSSMMDELRDLTEILPHLNIEHDPFLDGICTRLKASLAPIDVSELKEDKVQRDKVMREVDAILATFQTVEA